MSIQSIRDLLPEYAKDTKLNLGRLVGEDEVEGLRKDQALMIALASAYATKNAALIAATTAQVSDVLNEAQINAAKGAATIMGMNNIYYRFVHLVSDKSYSSMPANLRMNIIANSGVDKVDFELMSLAVSAINGCGMCLDAHVHEVSKAEISKQGIQSTIRIAAVINATAQALVIEGQI
jgi:alkyl hydroperoxide reductase subunit D